MDLIGEEPVLNLSDNKELRIYSKNTARFPQYLGENSLVKNSMICEGCRIYGEVENSIISGGVVIEEGAFVKDSVIMEDTVIKSGARVFSAIIDSEAVIENDVTVGTNNAGKDAIAVIASGAIVTKSNIGGKVNG